MKTMEHLLYFDPVKLIMEMKKRPTLYNTDHPADKSERLALWKEIGAALFTDWAQCSKAVAYDRVLQLQRKWRSLRDAYKREIRSRRSGSRRNKRVYRYFKIMSFLGGQDEGDKGTDDHEDDGDSDDNVEMPPEEITSDPLTAGPSKRSSKRRAKKPQTESEDETEIPMLAFEAPDEDRVDASDSDRLFLMSFVPEMKNLPVHIKMWARAQIASVMQEAVGCQYGDTLPDTRNFKRRRDSFGHDS